MDVSRYSKREVSRAGELLAQALRESCIGGTPAYREEEDNDAYVRARDVVDWWRQEHDAPMLEVHEVVEELAPPLDLQGAAVTAVSFRPKRFESVIEKLTPEPGKLADMVDLGGVRAVVSAKEHVDELRARLAARLAIRRVRDWSRSPRSTGYRAVHLHVRQAGRMIEVQPRTFGQDAWANVVEEESRNSGVNYKSGQGDADVLEFFRLVADFFAAFELGEPQPDIVQRTFDAYHAARGKLQTPILRDLDR